ncbi:MAG: pitrilysin family protein [Bacteroidota bacterium]|nr:pitrilysin family protein [Bacteroidota bacterium]
MDTFNKTILDNGITLISENIPYVKSISLGFWFNVGSRDEDLKTNGITHFIEHMVFKGTKKRTAKRIAEDIEAYGGYLNAFTSKEHTCYYGRGLDVNVERTFDVIADMVQYPVFKPSEMKKELSVIIDEMNDIDDNPEELIFDKFEEVLFKGNSLSLPIIGTEDTVSAFTQDDLFDYMNKHYGFNNLVIAGAGAINHNDLIKLVDKYFTRELNHNKVSRKFVKSTKPINKKLKRPIQQVHLIIGNGTYGFNSNKRITANILSHILGEGSSSRLFQSIREKHGIGYQLNSFINSFYDISAFGVYLSTNSNQAEKAEELVYNEFKKITEKEVSVKELNKAKEYIKGNMILSMESMSSRMNRIASSEIYYKKLITVDEVVKMINEVSPEDIFTLANEILDEKLLTKVVLSADK